MIILLKRNFMSEKKTATVRMEEGYMRATIQYNDPSYKAEICKAIVEIEDDLKIYPEIIHRRDSTKQGFCSVEFSGEDYICSRTCGEFIETLIKELKIEECVGD